MRASRSCLAPRSWVAGDQRAIYESKALYPGGGDLTDSLSRGFEGG